MPSRRSSARAKARCGIETAGSRRAAHLKIGVNNEKVDGNRALNADSAESVLQALSSCEEDGDCENITIGDLNSIYNGNDAIFSGNTTPEAMNLLNVSSSSSFPSVPIDISAHGTDENKAGQEPLSVYIISGADQLSPRLQLEVGEYHVPQKRSSLDSALESSAEMDASCDRAILLMKRDPSTLTFEEQREVKKYMRLLKNRESAQLSRHRKKMHLSALEQQVSPKMFCIDNICAA